MNESAIGAGVITIGVDDSRFVAGVEKDRQILQRFVGTEANVRLGIDPSSSAKFTADLHKLTGASGSTVKLKAALDDSAIRVEFRRLLADLQTQADANPIRLTVQGGSPGAGGFGSGGEAGRFGGGGFGGMGGLGRAFGVAGAVRAVAGAAEDYQRIPELRERIRKNDTRLTGDELLVGSSSFNGGSNPSASGMTSAAYLRSGGNWKNPFGAQNANMFTDTMYATTSRVPLVGELVKGLAGAFTSGPMGDAQKLSAQSDRLEAREQKSRLVMDRTVGIDDETAAVGASPEKRLAVRQAAEQRKLEAEISGLDSRSQSALGPQARASLSAKFAAENQYQGEQGQLVGDRYTLALSHAALSRENVEAMAKGAGGSDTTFANEQIAARGSLVQQQKTEMAGERDPDRRMRLQEAQESELKAFDEKAAQEKVERERSTQQRIGQVRASGQAALLKAAHDGYGAEMTEFEAHARTRLEAVRTSGKDEIEAVKTEIDQQRQALTAEHSQQIGDANAGYRDRIGAAGLRSNRRNFEADLLVDVGRQGRSIASLPPEGRGLAAQALQSETRQRIGEHGRQIRLEGNALEGHTEANKARASGMRLTGDVKDLRVDLDQQIENAPPELRAATMKNAKSRLDAERHELFDLHGGAQAVAVGQHEIFGDPLDLTGEGKDRKAAQADLDAARDKLGKNIAAGEDPNNPNGFSSGDKQSSDLLSRIAKACEDLVQKYSGVAVLGP